MLLPGLIMVYVNASTTFPFLFFPKYCKKLQRRSVPSVTLVLAFSVSRKSESSFLISDITVAFLKLTTSFGYSTNEPDVCTAAMALRALPNRARTSVSLEVEMSETFVSHCINEGFTSVFNRSSWS